MSEYTEEQIIKLKEKLAKAKRNSSSAVLARQLYLMKKRRDDWKEKCLIARRELDEAKLTIKRISKIIDGTKQ